MTTNIRMLISPTTDRIVAHAIDRYGRMDTKEARAAIEKEWPRNMAKVLSLYVAVRASSSSRNSHAFVDRKDITHSDDPYVDLLIDRRDNQ